MYSITGSQSNYVGADNPLRYRGYYYDTELKLYYLQSRYYDPETGRFISADVLLVAGDSINGTNMFAYCCNNPVNYIDPSGEEAITAQSIEAFLTTVALEFLGYPLIEELLEAAKDRDFGYIIDIGNDFLETNNDILAYAEHKKKGSTNPSNWNKHQKGETRRDVDAGKEKGDKRRTNYRKNKTKVNKSEIGSVILTAGKVVGLAYIVLNDFTGIGMCDDFLIPVLVGST